MRAVFFLAIAASAHGAAMELTAANFDTEVFNSGKSGFVKFFAPWCGHCKAMKPAWDELGSEYAGSKSVVIGDVDCTSDAAKDICEKHGVRGCERALGACGKPALLDIPAIYSLCSWLNPRPRALHHPPPLARRSNGQVLHGGDR